MSTRHVPSDPLIDVTLRFSENAAMYSGNAVGVEVVVGVTDGVAAVTVTVWASSRTVLSGIMMRNTYVVVTKGFTI